jgi:hypothetical protein
MVSKPVLLLRSRAGEVPCVDIVVEVIRSLVQQEDQGYDETTLARKPRNLCLFILTRTVQVPRRESCVAVLPEGDYDQILRSISLQLKGWILVGLRRLQGG